MASLCAADEATLNQKHVNVQTVLLDLQVGDRELSRHDSPSQRFLAFLSLRRKAATASRSPPDFESLRFA